MALSTIALASCTDDEELSARQETKEPISFRSAMGTRATETTNANLDKIYVTAFTTDSAYIAKNKAFNPSEADIYFKDVEFDKGSDSFFTAADGKTYDWLGDKQVMKFYSYSPSQDELGADIIPTEGQDGLTLQKFTVAEDIADQVDFITAIATGTKNANDQKGVELTFDHRLSQIEVRAKSENKTYTYQVCGVRIGRAEYIADFDFNTNKWTLDDWHNTAIYTSSCDTITLTPDPVSIMGPSGNAMLLPQKLYGWDPVADPDNVARDAYLSVLVRITRNDNGYVMYPFSDDTFTNEDGSKREYAWASIPISGTWEQGKKYIYTLDFTNGAGNVDPDDPTPGKPVLAPIKLKVTVNNWVDSESTMDMTPIK